MGAGRKTESYTLSHDGQYIVKYRTMSQRNLKKSELFGVIFGCKFSTIKESYAKKLFGLPADHMAYIKNIDPGLTLFLFNYSNRTLHGVFEATSRGELYIDPEAWSSNGIDPSPYPAQVKVRVRESCNPLPEEKFGPVIAENYIDEKIFLFELDQGQTSKILSLFTSSLSVRAPLGSRDAAPPPPRAIPAYSLAKIGDLGVTQVDTWSSLFKSSDDSSGKKDKGSKTQPLASQLGASFSSVVRNKTDSSSTLAKKTSFVPSQASNGVENPWSYASQVLSLSQDNGEFRNASKENIDVNVIAAYHQQIVHQTQKGNSATANNLTRPSKEDPDEDIYASSFKVHIDRVNMILEDARDEDCVKSFEGRMGQASSSSTFLDMLDEMLMEVQDLKHSQMKQTESMIALEMELLESRRKILWLQGRYSIS